MWGLVIKEVEIKLEVGMWGLQIASYEKCFVYKKDGMKRSQGK
jgi:hypothetical protein